MPVFHNPEAEGLANAYRPNSGTFTPVNAGHVTVSERGSPLPKPKPPVDPPEPDGPMPPGPIPVPSPSPTPTLPECPTPPGDVLAALCDVRCSSTCRAPDWKCCAVGCTWSPAVCDVQADCQFCPDWPQDMNLFQ
jgi:hypothetical protein